jgi:hypothetical protein
LTIEAEGDAPDDIALYLPKLKRVRKVAPTQRGQAFMDTDFNYADLGGSGADESDVSKLPDETVDGRPAHVLRGKAHPTSPYGEVTVYVDQATLVPLRVDYQGKDGALVKRFRALELKTFDGRVLAARASMENLTTASKTVLEILSLVPATLPDEAYTERGLERG